MVVTKDDLVFIKITQSMDITADYLSKKRLLFEYPRTGYGNYNKDHLPKIKIGILGELAFLEYILEHLSKKYGDLDSKERWSILHQKVGFSYLIVIGKFDEGHEFKIGKKNPLYLDIKTYSENMVTPSQIFNGLRDNNINGKPLNLFIDKTQNCKADIFVQTFMTKSNEIILAGYNEGLPSLADWMPNPAYTKPVPELEPMNKLLKKFDAIIQ